MLISSHSAYAVHHGLMCLEFGLGMSIASQSEVYNVGGAVSVMTGRDPDWSTHSAPGGGAGWASNRPAESQPTSTYR